jgi:hypothetical protein
MSDRCNQRSDRCNQQWVTGVISNEWHLYGWLHMNDWQMTTNDWQVKCWWWLTSVADCKWLTDCNKRWKEVRQSLMIDRCHQYWLTSKIFIILLTIRDADEMSNLFCCLSRPSTSNNVICRSSLYKKATSTSSQNWYMYVYFLEFSIFLWVDWREVIRNL